MYYWGVVPSLLTAANKGKNRDSLLKMVHNPGGHWHPRKGPYPMYYRYPRPHIFFQLILPVAVISFNVSIEVRPLPLEVLRLEDSDWLGQKYSYLLAKLE